MACHFLTYILFQREAKGRGGFLPRPSSATCSALFFSSNNLVAYEDALPQ